MPFNRASCHGLVRCYGFIYFLSIVEQFETFVQIDHSLKIAISLHQTASILNVIYNSKF